MECETKILSKALSNRFDNYLPQLINNDQHDFIQKRQGYPNIRRVLNILHENYNATDSAMLLVDACQAFDRIEWCYLFNVLPRFGLGEILNGFNYYTQIQRLKYSLITPYQNLQFTDIYPAGLSPVPLIINFGNIWPHKPIQEYQALRLVE